MKQSPSGKAFIKKWSLIAVAFLALFYGTRWGVWEAVIDANLTGFDVIMADSYLNFGPFILLLGLAWFVRRQWKKKKKAERESPLEESELEEIFKNIAHQNEDVMYELFIKKRFAMEKEEFFSLDNKDHLKAILNYHKKVHATQPDNALHPWLASRIMQVIEVELAEPNNDISESSPHLQSDVTDFDGSTTR
jgi:hypothetical protein